jgi:hypothetical protein
MGTAAGGGFEFTPQQIDLQLSRCSEMLSQLGLDVQNAQATQMAVRPPAPDAASVAQANAVKNFFAQTEAAFQTGLDFVSQWQTKLATAKTNYMQTEQLTADEWTRLSNGIES